MEHGVVDRFEGNVAVVLVGDPPRALDVPRNLLPANSREGHWLQVYVVDDQVQSVVEDETATHAAQQRIQVKLERLRRGDHLKGGSLDR